MEPVRRFRFGTLTAGAAPTRATILSFLGGSRLGLVIMALLVGGGAGLGAAAFRWLIFAFTWAVTGHREFGQQGRVPSVHVPWLGVWFLLIAPVVGGLLYGPLIYRFAREARGHGVPEVMLAVAENGGRIRPPVTIIKAIASALCIGVGGSVGREGPIVQIGSAFASTMGQLVRMSESRLRMIVACGAAGGIAATFNAPITGLFFGFEIVLREFSLDALMATILAAVTGDVVSRAFFGSAPFFAGMPHDLTMPSDYGYLLVAVLGVASGLLGYGFKTILYSLEDLVERLWGNRPEWALPAVGGAALGALLLLLPQMYGVGYPVMSKVIAGHVVVWLIVVMMLGKLVATSLTLSIGGSGGVFAPSLFIGAMAGTAFGLGADRVFGSTVGAPAMYAVVAMGGVFAGAAQAPLTSIASVVEMTGNFTLTLPVMLACGIAAALSKQLSYGSVYTTKLLRRGIDIDRPKATIGLRNLTVADAMQPLLSSDGPGQTLDPSTSNGSSRSSPTAPWQQLVGHVADVRAPQALFADETLEQALRQLALYGHAGLPVISHDGDRVLGWITRKNVLAAMARLLASTDRESEQAAEAAELSRRDPDPRVHVPTTPLSGYSLLELAIGPSSPALGHRLGQIHWPMGSLVVAVTEQREIVPPRKDVELRVGDRVIILAPNGAQTKPSTPRSAAHHERNGRDHSH
jgi:CIC family chloride channel protein